MLFSLRCLFLTLVLPSSFMGFSVADSSSQNTTMETDASQTIHGLDPFSQAPPVSTSFTPLFQRFFDFSLLPPSMRIPIVPANSSACPDLKCVRRRYRQLYKRDRSIDLEAEQALHFGPELQSVVHRMMYVLGLQDGGHQRVTNITVLKLSPNGLQLRLIGILIPSNTTQRIVSLINHVVERTPLSSPFKTKTRPPRTIIFEQVVTLEEQAYISVIVKLSLSLRKRKVKRKEKQAQVDDGVEAPPTTTLFPARTTTRTNTTTTSLFPSENMTTFTSFTPPPVIDTFAPVSLNDSLSLLPHITPMVVPKFLVKLFEAQVLNLGTFGGMREAMGEYNPPLQHVALQTIDFKHELKFSGYVVKNSMLGIWASLVIPKPSLPHLHLPFLDCNTITKRFYRRQCNVALSKIKGFGAERLPPTHPQTFPNTSLMSSSNFSSRSHRHGNGIGIGQGQNQGVPLLPPDQANLAPSSGRSSTARLELYHGHSYNPWTHNLNPLLMVHIVKIGITNIQLPSLWTLTRAMLTVAWKIKNPMALNFGFEGKLNLTLWKNVIQFKATASLPLTSAVAMRLNMINMITLPSKIPMAIGNLHASFLLVAGTVPLVNAFGGELHLGFPPERRVDTNRSVSQVDTRLKGLVFLTLSPTLSDTILYLKLSPLTVQSIVNAMSGTITRYQLPSWLGDTGITGLPSRHGKLQFYLGKHFQDTRLENEQHVLMTVSLFAWETQAIANMDSAAIIQPGITVMGRVTLLNTRANLYVRLDVVHLGFELEVSLDPIVLGHGLVALTAPTVERLSSKRTRRVRRRQAAHQDATFHRLESRHMPVELRNAGPYLYVAVQLIPRHLVDWNPCPQLRLAAQLSLFGAVVAIDVALSSHGFSLAVTLQVFEWFQAHCHVAVLSDPTQGGLGNGVRVKGIVTVGSLHDLSRGFYHSVLQKMARSFVSVMPQRHQRRRQRRRPASRHLRRRFSARVRHWKKRLRRLVRVELFSMTFDVNNMKSERSLPMLTTFKLSFFGHRVIYYRHNTTRFRLTQPLKDEEETALVSHMSSHMEACMVSCDPTSDTSQSCLETCLQDPKDPHP